VEPKTTLEKMIRSHQSADTDSEQQSRQFLLLMEWLREAGYEHYEISNFARPGFRSRHNSAYWQGIPYLGFGPGAHSYNGESRSWNVANNALYMQGIEQAIPVAEEEVLTTNNRINEYIMTSLRTIEGMDTRRIRDQFGDEHARALDDRIARYKNSGKLVLEDGVIRLTNEGKLFADGIAADLFC
jgi:oxygen-independent coproporphyrinogen-3 oxidase